MDAIEEGLDGCNYGWIGSVVEVELAAIRQPGVRTGQIIVEPALPEIVEEFDLVFEEEELAGIKVCSQRGLGEYGRVTTGMTKGSREFAEEIGGEEF